MGAQLSLFDPEPFEKAKAVLLDTPEEACDYLILISPSPKIKEQVFKLKELLDKKTGISRENLKSIPHISLLLVRQNKSCDNLIIETVKRGISGFSDFTISINGAITFEHTYTKDLVLKVNSIETGNIFNSLCSAFKIKKPASFVPHITIARGIPKHKFEKLDSLKDFDVYGDFLCRKITILKRAVPLKMRNSKLPSYVKIAELSLDKGISIA
jgi:2'-5' RNA ligase